VVPRLRFGQVVEGFFSKDRVEVAEVRGDVLFEVGRLGIPFMSFCEPLGDCGCRSDVLRLGLESGCPYPIAFLERFIGEVVGLVLSFVCIFYEGGHRARPTSMYPLSILL